MLEMNVSSNLSVLWKFSDQAFLIQAFFYSRLCYNDEEYIVGKGAHTPPFSRSPPLPPLFPTIPPFLEIQDVPTLFRPIKKIKSTERLL